MIRCTTQQGNYHGKQQRMGGTTMAKIMRVGKAKMEGDDIQIGQYADNDAGNQ